MVLIDWEDGRTRDVPCWDALHFAFQQAALVKRLESHEIEAEIRKRMGEGELAELIRASGWAGNEELLFASYLIAMATEDSHISNLLGARAREKTNG